MFLEFFVIGSLWFWLLSAIIVGLMLFAIEKESGTGATAMFASYLAIIWLFGDFNPLPWLAQNPKSALAIVVLYFLLGTGWGVIKWMSFCYGEARKTRLGREAFRADYPADTNFDGERMQSEWRSYCRNNSLRLEAPKIRQHKDQYMMWMTYWPLSAFWTGLNDPIRRIFSEIYHRMSGGLQRISDKAFANVA